MILAICVLISIILHLTIHFVFGLILFGLNNPIYFLFLGVLLLGAAFIKS
jgi:hypothetical protein